MKFDVIYWELWIHTRNECAVLCGCTIRIANIQSDVGVTVAQEIGAFKAGYIYSLTDHIGIGLRVCTIQAKDFKSCQQR
jgi:hypothetical protein